MTANYKPPNFRAWESYRRFSSTRVLRQAGWRTNLELYASIQVLCWLTVLCSRRFCHDMSETRPNAKPENVSIDWSGIV